MPSLPLQVTLQIFSKQRVDRVLREWATFAVMQDTEADKARFHGLDYVVRQLFPHIGWDAMAEIAQAAVKDTGGFSDEFYQLMEIAMIRCTQRPDTILDDATPI